MSEGVELQSKDQEPKQGTSSQVKFQDASDELSGIKDLGNKSRQFSCFPSHEGKGFGNKGDSAAMEQFKRFVFFDFIFFLQTSNIQ